jgi:hypothetical protein
LRQHFLETYQLCSPSQAFCLVVIDIATIQLKMFYFDIRFVSHTIRIACNRAANRIGIFPNHSYVFEKWISECDAESSQWRYDERQQVQHSFKIFHIYFIFWLG